MQFSVWDNQDTHLQASTDFLLYGQPCRISSFTSALLSLLLNSFHGLQLLWSQEGVFSTGVISSLSPLDLACFNSSHTCISSTPSFPQFPAKNTPLTGSSIMLFLPAILLLHGWVHYGQAVEPVVFHHPHVSTHNCNKLLTIWSHSSTSENCCMLSSPLTFLLVTQSLVVDFSKVCHPTPCREGLSQLVLTGNFTNSTVTRHENFNWGIA